MTIIRSKTLISRDENSGKVFHLIKSMFDLIMTWNAKVKTHINLTTLNYV